MITRRRVEGQTRLHFTQTDSGGLIFKDNGYCFVAMETGFKIDDNAVRGVKIRILFQILPRISLGAGLGGVQTFSISSPFKPPNVFYNLGWHKQIPVYFRVVIKAFPPVFSSGSMQMNPLHSNDSNPFDCVATGQLQPQLE